MLVDIAANGNGCPVSVSDISKRTGVSVKYLEQLIRPLKSADYLKSVRGPKGGHMLTKPASEITVGEVVRLLEGGLMLARCEDDPDLCPLALECPLRTVWASASKAMNDILDSITLDELSSEYATI
jgi:Rrf2 family protein